MAAIRPKNLVAPQGSGLGGDLPGGVPISPIPKKIPVFENYILIVFTENILILIP